MAISTQAPQLQRVIALRPIYRNLIFAQQRLQDRHVPFELAALSYLRICCSAMQTYRRLGFDVTLPVNSKTPYLTLLNQLIAQHPDWWKLCYVNANGYLVSDDRSIQKLLHPLNEFVAQLIEHPISTKTA